MPAALALRLDLGLPLSRPQLVAKPKVEAQSAREAVGHVGEARRLEAAGRPDGNEAAVLDGPDEQDGHEGDGYQQRLGPLQPAHDGRDRGGEGGRASGGGSLFSPESL